MKSVGRYPALLLFLLLALLPLGLLACSDNPTNPDPIEEPVDPDPTDPDPTDPDPTDPDPTDPDPTDPDPTDPDPTDPDPTDPDPTDPDPTDPDPSDPDPVELAIAVTGWIERGAEVEIHLTGGGAALSPGDASWRFEPAGAVDELAPGQLRLLQAGTVTVSVEYEGSTATHSLDVAAPPSIVFDRQVGGTRSLWRVALDGGELTRLTDGPADDVNPSQAAGEIVFVSYRDANAEIYALSAAGGAARRLTSTADVERAPALSSDGTRIAYIREVGGLAKLWTMTASGENQAQLVDGVAGEIHASPAWRPGSGDLAYVSTAGGNADIYLRTASGEITPLVTGAKAEVEPAWDATGERLAFVSNRDGDTELYLYDTQTRTITRLTQRSGTDAQPTWLPDGRIVYVASVGGTPVLRWLDPDEPAQVYDIPTGGGEVGNPTAEF